MGAFHFGTLGLGRGRAPVPTLLAANYRGNHGGIAPTKMNRD